MRKTVLIGTLCTLMLGAASAGAGTKGALYDIRVFLYEPHPFTYQPNPYAMAGVGLAPAVPPRLPADVMRQPAPPRPTYGMPEARMPTSTPPPPAYAPPGSRSAAPPPPPPTAPPSAGTTGPAGASAYRTVEREPSPLPGTTSARPAPPPEDDMFGRLFSRLYFSFSGGLDFPDDLGGKTSAGNAFTTETDPGYMLAAALGRYYDDNIRGELELAFRQADYDSTSVGGTTRSGGDISVTTLMANGYYGFRWNSPFVPYIGAGLGLALLDGTDVTVAGQTAGGRDGAELGYQGLLGLAYMFGEGLSVGVEGRYLGTTDDDVSSGTLAVNARFDL